LAVNNLTTHILSPTNVRIRACIQSSESRRKWGDYLTITIKKLFEGLIAEVKTCTLPVLEWQSADVCVDVVSFLHHHLPDHPAASLKASNPNWPSW